jgi:hypothetical protein
MPDLGIFEASTEPEREPVTFGLKFNKVDSNQRIIPGEHEILQFTAMGDPGVGLDMTIGRLVRYDQRGRQIVDINGIMEFYRRVLPEDEYAVLHDAIYERHDIMIPSETFGDAFNELMEVYTGRPTREQRRSSGSLPGNGRRSTATRSSKASTSRG